MKASNVEVKVMRTLIEIDGVSHNTSVILKFLEEASEYEDSIGKTENWSNDYIYFNTVAEKAMEPMLLRRKVIRLNPNYKRLHKQIDEWNALTNRIKRPGLTNQMKPRDITKKYLLDEGWHEFHNEIWNEFNKLEKLNK